MSWMNPWGLLGLSAMLPVIAFYFLKLRRRKVEVSSTWLWSKALQDLQVNAPFQRLRSSLLLLLQLLLIALAAAALSDPVARASAPHEKRWAILVDRSASMSMKDVKPSRLDRAKEAAKGLLDAMGPSDEVMIVTFSDRAQVMMPFTSDRTAAARAIDAVKPSDAPTRAQEAFRIASSALAPYPERTLAIVSDGRFEPLQGVEAGLDLRYVPVGAQGRNDAITAIEARRPTRNGEPWTIFGQVERFGGAAGEVPVECYVNGELKGVRKVAVAPGAPAAVLFEVSRPEPEVAELKLAAPDDLAADDRAWAAVRPGRARILLAGASTFFLERALAGVKDADAFRAAAFVPGAGDGYDVVVIDGDAPPQLPEGRYLVFGRPPAWEGMTVGPAVETPPVTDWERRHPVARQVGFSGIYVKSCPKITLPPFASAVVEGPEDLPLVIAYEKGRTRMVVVPFPLLESDWPLRLSFPLFVSNALDWLRDEERAHPRPGEALRIRLGDNEGSVTVTGPHGRKETLAGEPGTDVVYGDTEQAGLYTVARTKGAEQIAVNLADPRESQSGAAPEIRTSAGQAAAGAAPPPVLRAWWRWIAFAALVLLCAEWAVFHRRWGT